jgi:hypothetical protein
MGTLTRILPMCGTMARLAFFDLYIIRLAKKLAECGSSFEYLNFAIRNRDEWISKGREIFQEMKRTAAYMFAHRDTSSDCLEPHQL